jgi:hypothetical protein
MLNLVIITYVLLNCEEQNLGRCPLSLSAGSSKIKIGTSSPYKANLALYGDEVRILIFDDPAENERGQRPELEGKLSNPRELHA